MNDETSPATEPLYAKSFGYSLAMRVMQSELYPKLDGAERADCDELIYRGQAAPAPLQAEPTDAQILHLWDAHVGEPTEARPLSDKDKIAFARAVLYQVHFAAPQTEAKSLQPLLDAALDALGEIALAGMGGSGQESEDGMTAWHARRAWEFIGIAARARDAARAALRASSAPTTKQGD